MRYTKYPELKRELKKLAEDIKKLKHKRDHWQEYGENQWKIQAPAQSEVYFKAREYRHMHIAYCLLRGVKYRDIEQPRKNNKPDFDWVDMTIRMYEKPKAELGAV